MLIVLEVDEFKYIWIYNWEVYSREF